MFIPVRVLLPQLRRLLHDRLVAYVAQTMSEDERAQIMTELAQRIGTLWTSIPEPLVARIARPDYSTTLAQADVQTNNAGMRSARPYEQKSANVFRIVCLGDSFVFGEGGPVPQAKA